MKKFLLTVILAIIGSWSFAQDRTPDGFKYEIIIDLDMNMTVEITEYTGNAVTLNVPEYIQGMPVTAISGIAVKWPGMEINYNNTLISITIPSSVTSIEIWEAFSACRSLTNITVDNRNPVYASIDGVLFDKNFQTLFCYPQGRNQGMYIIPSSVNSIGDEAFRSCESLTGVTIPSSITSIGNLAFAECRNLTSITLPSSVFSIGFAAFANCSILTSVTLSRHTQVAERAFPASVRITYRD